MIVTAGLLLAGCSSTPSAKPWDGTQLDEFGWAACRELRSQATGAGGFEVAYVLPVAARGPFAADVARFGGLSSTVTVKEQATGLAVAAADPSPLAWRAALNRTVSACSDAGYPELSLKPGG